MDAAWVKAAVAATALWEREKKREDRCRFVLFGVGVEQEKRPSNVRVDSPAVGTANQHTRHRILITLMLLLQLR